MNMIDSRSVQSVISELSAQHLELAPEGWRQCVEKIAEGFAEVAGGHVYCLNCDGMLQGAQGHDVHCVTMVARRMLANEPLIRARLLFDSVDRNEHGHHTTPSFRSGHRTRRSYNRPRLQLRHSDVQYVVPKFLHAEPPVRES